MAKPERRISADGSFSSFLCSTTVLTTEWVLARLGQGVVTGHGCTVGLSGWRCNKLLGGRALKRGQKNSNLSCKSVALLLVLVGISWRL